MTGYVILYEYIAYTIKYKMSKRADFEENEPKNRGGRATKMDGDCRGEVAVNGSTINIEHLGRGFSPNLYIPRERMRLQRTYRMR